MSIFGSIVSAIFGSPAHADEITPQSKPMPAAPAPSPIQPPVASASAGAAPSKGGAPAAGSVDVSAVLDKAAEDADESLDWRKSIVDLMKILKLDSSLKARKQLATELKYSGDMNDSATMNIWLHKEVMTQLAANGGKVPDDLKH